MTCSPRFSESKGILIRKGTRKIRFKEIPKRKILLIRLGDVHALLPYKPQYPHQPRYA